MLKKTRTHEGLGRHPQPNKQEVLLVSLVLSAIAARPFAQCHASHLIIAIRLQGQFDDRRQSKTLLDCT
eukprot:5326475-Amphidinium_carterae.1